MTSQSVYEDVARDTNRGHTVRAVCESFQMSKDAGFKVVAHMMPDLPNVDLERDIQQFVVRAERAAWRQRHAACLVMLRAGTECWRVLDRFVALGC